MVGWGGSCTRTHIHTHTPIHTVSAVSHHRSDFCNTSSTFQVVQAASLIILAYSCIIQIMALLIMFRSHLLQCSLFKTLAALCCTLFLTYQVQMLMFLCRYAVKYFNASPSYGYIYIYTCLLSVYYYPQFLLTYLVTDADEVYIA